MIIDSKKRFNIKKIHEFDELMIKTAKTNCDSFEFDDNRFFICSDGVIVQTLICNRILYRIYIDKNNDFIHDELFKYF